MIHSQFDREGIKSMDYGDWGFSQNFGQDIRSHPAHGSAHLAPMILPKATNNLAKRNVRRYDVGTKPFLLSSKRNLECNLFCWLRLTSCIAGWARIELDVHPNWGVKMICSTTWMGYMANRWHRWSSEYISIYSAELARDPNHPRVPRVPQFGTNLPFLLVGSCFTSLITVGSDGFLFSNRTWPWQVEQHCLVSPKVLYPSRSSIAKSPFIYIYII